MGSPPGRRGRIVRALRSLAVAGEIAEEVEAQRHRREEVGEEPLFLEHLEPLWRGEPRAHGRERTGRHQVRAGGARERELESAAHLARAGLRRLTNANAMSYLSRYQERREGPGPAIASATCVKT